MKKIIIASFLCFFLLAFQEQSKIYINNSVKITLFSEAPLENIEATSVKGISVFNATTGEIQFTIPIKSLKFRKSLMEEHFNENYMESDTYPNAKFKGKINQKIDLQKNGEFAVTATGELDVHGVKKSRTITGTLTIDQRSINLNAKFNVLCADHRIKIPQLVFQKIAESIQITVSGNYIPYKSSK